MCPSDGVIKPKKIYALIHSEREKECTKHLPRWNGTIPCTGRFVCMLCGTEIDDHEFFHGWKQKGQQ